MIGAGDCSGGGCGNNTLSNSGGLKSEHRAGEDMRHCCWSDRFDRYDTCRRSNEEAGRARYSKEYNRCMNTGLAARGVTSGIMNCSGSEIRRQDARRNQACKMVMARSTPQQKTTLRASERNWVDQRDEGCEQVTAPLEGGTLAMIIYSGCILDETINPTI